MGRAILIAIFSFASGIALSSFIFLPPLISVLILIVGAVILIPERNKEVILLSVILISFSLGALRYSIKDFHEPLKPASTGIVVSEPEDKDNFRRFVYLSDNNEKILVSAPLYSPVQYGDRVEVDGKLEKPGIIEEENGARPFDYSKYLAKDDIYYTLSFAKVEILSSGHGNSLKSALFKLKRSFVAKAKEILAEPYASLLMGLIVSGREALPKDILEEFRRAGVIHIVVLSGFNITLIADFLRRVSKSNKIPLIGIILFVIMTGAEASIVRAAIMAGVATSAKLFGRKYSAPRALIFAACLMIIHNPKILIFDPSFQLSFLATLGLIYFMPPIEKRLTRVTQRLKIREILSQTLATQLMVLPLLIYMSGDVSLVSIPANMLILLIVPYTMLVGFLATLVAFVSTIIAWPLAYVSHILLSWILLVSHTLGNLFFATIKTPLVSIWIVISVYLIFVAVIKFSSTFPQFKFTKKSST
ncbi:MAG: ComEC/Rec2 family competence protein [Candidatus Zambryskibacteria bacterium]|nr:ComEC/Rec2 family competence protein [Candidatus Zambryskibacteria bacterium]